jgi:hypothetical protein
MCRFSYAWRSFGISTRTSVGKWECCSSFGRVLVSHDRDYVLLHRAWGDWFSQVEQPPSPRDAGIVLIPQHPVLSLAGTVEMLKVFLGDIAQESFANRLYDWTANDGWQEFGAAGE